MRCWGLEAWKEAYSETVVRESFLMQRHFSRDLNAVREKAIGKSRGRALKKERASAKTLR